MNEIMQSPAFRNSPGGKVLELSMEALKGAYAAYADFPGPDEADGIEEVRAALNAVLGIIRTDGAAVWG